MGGLAVNDLPRVGTGRSFPLAGEGRRLLVVYKAACPTCRLLLPLLESIYRRAEGGLDMILVSQDDGTVTARTQSELELSLPVLLDGPLWKLSSSLGAVSVPMIVELEGREVAGVTEGFNKAEMRLVLERLARGKRLGWKVSSALDAPELPEHKPG